MTTQATIRKIATWAKDLDQDVTIYAARITRWQDRDTIRPQLKELRSAKHSALAIAFDMLGNIIVLWPDGSTRQYITNQEAARAGLLDSRIG